MKREVSDLDFLQCPTTDIDSGHKTSVYREPVMPIIPQTGDGVTENVDPISRADKVKKVLKIAAIITVAALFVVFCALFVMNNPELFKIEPSGKPFWKW